MRDREEPVQAGVGKLRIPDPRSDLNTEKASVAHAQAHFIDGSVGVLQSDGPQRSEAGGVLVSDPGEEFILRRCQFGSARDRRRVTERHRNRGKHLHPNAFTVHVGDPSLW
jgi:hypothetical protein